MDLFDYDVARQYADVFLGGLLTTVSLTLIVIVISGVAAIPVALGRMMPAPWIRYPLELYVEVVRGTPLILQLVYIYFVLPMAGIRIDPYAAAVVALSLNYTAYMSEVYRSGINAVPPGQRQAAQALGMMPATAFIRITLPQAFRIVTPSLGNYFIALFKDTALASVVTVPELMFSGNLVSANTYQYFTVYTVTGVLYLLASLPVVILVRYLEKRSGKGYGQTRRNAKRKRASSALASAEVSQ